MKSTLEKLAIFSAGVATGIGGMFLSNLPQNTTPINSNIPIVKTEPPKTSNKERSNMANEYDLARDSINPTEQASNNERLIELQKLVERIDAANNKEAYYLMNDLYYVNRQFSSVHNHHITDYDENIDPIDSIVETDYAKRLSPDAKKTLGTKAIAYIKELIKDIPNKTAEVKDMVQVIPHFKRHNSKNQVLAEEFEDKMKEIEYEGQCMEYRYIHQGKLFSQLTGAKE